MGREKEGWDGEREYGKANERMKRMGRGKGRQKR